MPSYAMLVQTRQVCNMYANGRHDNPLLECSASKSWENEGGLVDLSVVVTAELLLLLGGEGAERLGDVAATILAADHEADLARWVGWDGGVAILDGWEDLLAILLELGDQWEVEPLVLSYETVSIRCGEWYKNSKRKK